MIKVGNIFSPCRVAKYREGMGNGVYVWAASLHSEVSVAVSAVIKHGRIFDEEL